VVNPFLQSVFVQPPVVLESQLQPFSAYHAAAMMILGSPFMDGGTVTREDLVLAVYVCSRGFEDGPAHLFPLDADEVSQCAHDFDFAAEMALFEEYMGDHMSFPDVFQPKGGGKQSGIPWPFYAVATVLQGMGGISEQEAWDMPISRLVGYKAAIAEQAGADVQSQDQSDAVALFEREE